MKKIFPILALAMFSSNLGMGIVAPLLSIYAQDLGATGVGMGIAMSSYAIANIFSTPLFGRLSDKRGRKIFLSAGLLAYSLISIAYIFTNSLATLAVVRLFHGAAGGMVLPIASAYIGDISPRGEEGKWMGYSSAAFYAGFGAGPLIGGIMSQHLGISSAFAFMGSLNFLAFLVVFFFLPRIEPKSVSKPQLSRPSYKTILKSNMVKGMFFYQLTAAVGQGSFSTFLPIIATVKGLSMTLIGILISITMSLMSLIGPVAGVIADRGNKRLLVVGGTILIILALSLMPSFGPFWQILVLAILLALGAGISMPSISALSVGEGRKFGMGSTMGVVSMGMSVGFATGPIIAGQVVDITSTAYAFYFGALVALMGLGPFIWFTRPAINETPVVVEGKSKVDKEP